MKIAIKVREVNKEKRSSFFGDCFFFYIKICTRTNHECLYKEKTT